MVYDCTQKMDVEWDPDKARLNVRKHGIHFSDALPVLEDENALTMTEESADGEERWITLGAGALGRILVVVYTWRGRRVRVISARPATPRERRQYGEGL